MLSQPEALLLYLGLLALLFIIVLALSFVGAIRAQRSEQEMQNKDST